MTMVGLAQGIVSIHAPNEGSDTVLAYGNDDGWEFQSTLPMKGATWRSRLRITDYWFQSTLPMKGATLLPGQHTGRHQRFNPRSQ